MFGVWTASSLAAYWNGPVWAVCLAGLLLFPLGPLLWELWAARRRANRESSASSSSSSFFADLDRNKRNERFLSVGDRLMLRTLFVNGLFMTVLLYAWPGTAYTALSGRGDWMLDGREDPYSNGFRDGLHAASDRFEWLLDRPDDNPYEQLEEHVDDKPIPVPPPPVPPPVFEPEPDFEGPEEEVADQLFWPIEDTLHPRIVDPPAHAEQSVEALGTWLLAEFPDQRERVRAMHDWVADNIAYDFVALDNLNYGRGQTSAIVFEHRVGVCAGYANLMVALGKVTGDEIVYLTGKTREEDGSIAGISHAWNAAKVDGDWVLIDATWDAGHRGEDRGFKKDYRTDYLFTPPEVFITTHLPKDDKWQLLSEPVSRGDFIRMPMMQGAFYAQGLSFHGEMRSQVTADGALHLVLDNPKRKSLLVTYEPRGGGKKQDCKVKGKLEDTLTVDCYFGGKGTYDLMLYTADELYVQHWSVGRIEVNSTRAAGLPGV